MLRPFMYLIFRIFGVNLQRSNAYIFDISLEEFLLPLRMKNPPPPPIFYQSFLILGSEFGGYGLHNVKIISEMLKKIDQVYTLHFKFCR